MPSTVRVTIKAANGAVDDFRVDAEPEWSVQRLKNHIYRHYPTHPPVTSQKLIHGGRLLLEHETLQELFPDQRGEHPVVIHLVAYQRSLSVPNLPTRSTQPASQPSSGRDAEASTRSPQPQAQPERPHPPQQLASSPPASPPWVRHRLPPHAPGQGLPVHNLPMMPGMAAGGPYGFPQFYMSPYGAAYATQMAWYYNYYGRQPPGGPDGAQQLGGNEADVGVNPEPVRNNEEDQVEEMGMNGGGLGMVPGGGLQRQRDIVDYIYMLMMAAFLVAVAYLTGSLGRMLIFAAGIIFMLLNQAGWFALQRRRQVREMADPLAAHGRNQQAAQHGEGRVEGGEENGGNEMEDGATDNPLPMRDPPVPDEPPQPGLLATLFVFITSFFTSLIPQQRPELMMN